MREYKRVSLAIVAVLALLIGANSAAAQTTTPAGQGPAATKAEEKGPTLVTSFEGSSNRDGQVMQFTTAGGYNFNKYFGVGLGVPVFFVRASTASGTQTNNGLGDVFANVHLTFANPLVNYRTTLTGTIPTGDSSRGLSTGHATADWTNHFDRSFGRLTPFVEAGIANSIFDQRFFRRPFATFGPLAHFEGGAEWQLLGPLSIGASAYDIAPWGEQRVFSRLVPGSTTSPPTRGRRSFETSAQTTGSADLTRDNGYSAWINLTPVKALAFEAGYSRSVPLQLDTLSFGVVVNLSSLVNHGRAGR